MIRLITLGEIQLRRSDGEPVVSVLQQPRRFALLVYLALSDATLVRRDTLLALFWAEKPEVDARHDASQAVHYLRRALGTGVIQGRGTEGFGITPGSLSCDAREFLDALRRGDRPEALRLYRGDLLPGFFAPAAPAFEQWLEALRGQLRRQAADAAWQVAECDAAVNPVSAAAVARRAVDLSLGDEAAVRRLLELLQRIGDRAGALEAYDAFRRRLAVEYGAEPDQETLRLAARLRASSPATILSSTRANDSGVAASTEPPAPPAFVRGKRPNRERPLRALLSAAITLALLATFVSMWGLSRSGDAEAIVPTVVVEELQDYSRGLRRDDLAGAVTSEVLARLTGVGSMRVRPADAAPEVRDDDQPHHLVLRAGLLQSADSVRVTAILLDGPTRVLVDRGFVVTPVNQSIPLVDEIAGWLAGFARAGAGGWLKEHRWRRHDREGRAFSLLRNALADRKHADSLRLAGAVDAALAMYRLADSLLARAEGTAPGWSEPSIQRAETALRLMWLHLLSAPPDLRACRANLRTGLTHAERAIQKGADPAALEIRGVLGHWLLRTVPADSYSVAVASLPGIERDLRAAVERDPTRARAWSMLAALLHHRGDFGEARWAAERAHVADAFLEHAPEVAGILFSTAIETGDRRAAQRWCDEMQKRRPGENAAAFCELMILATFGASGATDVQRGWAAIGALPATVRDSPPWKDQHNLLMGVLLARAGALDSAAAMLKRASRSPGDAESAQLLAWGLLELGHADSAAAVLERYVSVRPDTRVGVLRSERFRALREHPRIGRLIRTAASVPKRTAESGPN